MKNKKELSVLILVSVFLGLILSIQLKTVNRTVGEGVLPTQRAQQLAAELRKAQEEKESYENLIDELEEKIDQYERGEIDKSAYAENLYKDIVKYRMLSGYLDLVGEGIVLEINDPSEDLQFGEGFTVVDNIDIILQTISILNAAGAEAISINDLRYTTYTEIVVASKHIEINGVSTNSPIVIKAIGNPSLLESALMLKGGIVWQLRQYNYSVHLTQEKEVLVPKYKKVKDFKYAVPVEG